MLLAAVGPSHGPGFFEGLLILVYLGVFIVSIVIVWRFMRAHEKLADAAGEIARRLPPPSA